MRFGPHAALIGPLRCERYSVMAQRIIVHEVKGHASNHGHSVIVFAAGEVSLASKRRCCDLLSVWEPPCNRQTEGVVT